MVRARWMISITRTTAVRTVGEQLYAQFGVGLGPYGPYHPWKDERDNEVFTPVDLYQCKNFSSVINPFFGTSQLSSVPDQTTRCLKSPHKRRISRRTRWFKPWACRVWGYVTYTILTMAVCVHWNPGRSGTLVWYPLFAFTPRSMTWALSKPLP